MANTFGILAALVLAFSAFVAFKNKEDFEKQKIASEGEADRLKRNENTYDGLVADIDGLTQEKVEANAKRDDFQAKLEDQNGKNKAVADEISEKEGELTSTKERVADKEEKLKELGDLELLAPKIERLQASTDELTDQVAILNTQVDRLRGEKSRTADALATAKKKLSDITSGRSLPTMKTKIRTISRSLGFVTLGTGMNGGVIGGSKVAVMRGGEKVAELNVTAVSANTATADIVQSSLKEGESVSVGDTVIPAEEAGK